MEDKADDNILVDVREDFEWTLRRIPGAELISMGAIDAAIPRLSKIDTVYVHCQSGGRSSRICTLLNGAGVNAVNVEGGINAWERAGYEVVRG